ncbi:MarR family winged helix-turn-helix transcriptional regulator [Alicyclobacillus suci]|uniref:MarR family winged helix-turn-helix transcriptional regulator n=1 Tax=Alicyclobacillus suci TaxID=2816080 RepID=UPI001A8F8FEA|nr:MarR family transcriptional regulator [Alicyclobacillus suci]
MDDNNASVLTFFDGLQRLIRLMRRTRLWDGHAITRVQRFILTTLTTQGPCTIGQLAERLDVRPSTMSTMIDRLELAKLVRRTTSHEDARVKIVELTDEGKAIVESVRSAIMKELADSFTQLTEEEQMTFSRLVAKLSDILQKQHEGHD